MLVVVNNREEIKHAQLRLKHISLVTEFPVDLVWVDRETFERKKMWGDLHDSQ